MAEYRILQSAHDFEALLEESHHQRVALLKHSTSCPISHLAKGRIDKALEQAQLDMPVYYLDLLRHRAISNAIASELGVQHESPQIIVIENGRAVYEVSHLEIDPARMPKAA